MVEQRDEDAKRLFLQAKAASSLPKFTGVEVDLEWPETA
jgi:hypothetical protein